MTDQTIPKNMQLSKAYEPHNYEADIYALWEQSGAFAPTGKGEPFSVIMPPPNSNAPLHVGHCLFVTIEDIMTRYHRMKGQPTLWLPGADHAGFETWVVYEKKLETDGKSRFDFSREELYKQVWDFVADNKEVFFQQFRALGASCDWSRFTFTLDDKVVNTAYQTFQKMWNDKLIYRGKRLVNYCTTHGTSFADIEVNHETQKRALYQIRYPLTDGSGDLIVATTRPETLFGDTAVAIHPDDPRAASMKGKTVRLPLTERDIPIITDEFVDREFGTGAVKITPAHDFNDAEVGERHSLPLISVIDFQGKLNHEVPDAFQGMPVLEAREKVSETLDLAGFLVKKDDYEAPVSVCYKCGNAIEPLLMEQWFVDMEKLRQPAIDALKSKKITFYPDSKRVQLIHYLEQLKDWNISRQIAWGIPIPAFQSLTDQSKWIFDERVGEATIEIGGETFRRDPDVFDTWFSSSQWPYITLGYPEGEDFKQFYPTSVMETAADILYPWVSRMIMMGLYVTGELPFKEVYLHGLVLGPDGQKMSKSKGNVVNPQEQLDQFGADAIRLGLITNAVAGANQPYSSVKTVGGRNYCNKLWNIARYIEQKNDSGESHHGHATPQTDADHWILSKLQRCINNVSVSLDKQRYGSAYDQVYHFVWDDLADWYIEASKATTNLALLQHILETVLKLTHPFAPFVTETIWQTLGKKDQDALLISSAWPETSPRADAKKAAQFEEIKAIVSEIRNIAGVLQMAFPAVYFKQTPFIADNAELLKRLARLSACQEVEAGRGLHLTHTKHDVWLDIDPETARQYLAKLKEQAESRQQTVKLLETRLSNEGYVKNAPKELIAESKAKLAEESDLLAKVQAEIDTYSSVIE